MKKRLIKKGLLDKEPEDIMSIYKKELERLRLERKASLKAMLEELLLDTDKKQTTEE